MCPLWLSRVGGTVLVSFPLLRETTPAEVARLQIRGGLLYARGGTPYGGLLRSRVDYSRSVPDLPRHSLNYRPRRGYRRRMTVRPRRLVRTGPPLLEDPTFRPDPQRWTRPFVGPRGGRLLVDKVSNFLGWPSNDSVARWVARFTPPVKESSSNLGVPSIKCAHRGRRRFARWSPQGGLSFRPRQQGDPLQGYLDWSRLTGTSPLRGLRWKARTRREVLARRRRGLLRRRRDQTRLLHLLARLNSYRGTYFSRRRRRLKGRSRRYFFFRRRRVRCYLARRVTPRNYLRGVTRRAFRSLQVNRLARLERSELSRGLPYYSASYEWFTNTLETRVAVPLEYNLRHSLGKYQSFEMRRREGSRRWKLGQHPWWAGLFREAREKRWSWFAQTRVAPFVRGEPHPSESANPPLRPGFKAEVYWSLQKWGRSRWRTRPTRRATSVFVGSIKRGNLVEYDALQWGRAGTSATGVSLSLGLEEELSLPSLPDDEPPELVVLDFPYPPPRKPRVVAFFWKWFFSPFWVPYNLVGVSLCRLAWGVRWLFWGGFALGGFIFTFFHTLLVGQLVRPLRVLLVHWVKERRLVKTLSWVYTSWLLVYSSEDDLAELDVPGVDQDNVNLAEEENLDQAEENEVDFDHLGEGIQEGTTQATPLNPRWLKDWDSFLDDATETLEDLLLGEFPYRVGLFLRPFADVLVRLPLWGLLEGISLVGLTLKLEWQTLWYSFLTRGGWKRFPVVVVAYLLRWGFTGGVAYLLITQLEYSSLRLWVTYSCGLPWHEEYFWGWCCFCGSASVYLAGPLSWRKFLFGELGPANLMGLFVGTTEVATPEEYYPLRPGRPLRSAVYSLPGGRRPLGEEDKFFQDRTWIEQRNNFGYDTIRVVLARGYGLEDPGLDLEHDYELGWFVFPLHRSHPEEGEENFSRSEHVPFMSRSVRHPYQNRAYRYDRPLEMDVFWYGLHLPRDTRPRLGKAFILDRTDDPPGNP